MRAKLCSIDGCNRQVRARGWCSAHHHRWRKYGDPLGRAPRLPELCVIEGCGRKRIGRGWCGMHYSRWRKHGDPLITVNRPKVSREGNCSAGGCFRRIQNNGLCATHYTRWRRHGHPQVEVPIIPKVIQGPICAVGDCDSRPVARGWCQKHWSRWRTYGDPLGSAPKGPSIEERFWAKVDKNGPGGCWLWTGSVDVTGYGQFNHDLSGSRKAHRYAYMISVGFIPKGMAIDHKCRVRSCVNPAHLRLATPSQNSQNVSARTGSKSGIRGVRQDARGRWNGRVTYLGCTYSAGTHDTPAQAEAAVKKLRRQLFTHNDDDWSGIQGQLDIFGETA